MSRHLTLIAAALLLGGLQAAAFASPRLAATIAPLAVDYLDETALVFRARRQPDNPLPASIIMAGVPLTFASDIERACRSVHARDGDVLAFLPESRSCLSLPDLFVLAREVHPDRASFGLQERDRKALQAGLEQEPYLVLQPRSASPTSRWLNGEVLAGVCTCPELPDPIFDDGFETIP